MKSDRLYKFAGRKTFYIWQGVKVVLHGTLYYVNIQEEEDSMIYSKVKNAT